jgi:NADPH-dependent ferric siderophore reductase
VTAAVEAVTRGARRVRDAAARAAYARSMAVPAERTDHACFPVTVTAVAQPARNVRRLTLAAPELQRLTMLGPDEFFGLLMPGEGQTLPDLSGISGPNPRPVLAELPPEQQPALRWYTVRAHRPALGEVDVDVVVHGDAGPGSAWVRRARVGQVAAYQTGTACYRRGHGGHQVIAGDETAVPAIAAILEQLDDEVVPHVFVEVPSARDDLPGMPSPPRGTVTVVERGTGEPGSALLTALRAADLPGLTYGWACGEQALAAAVRRHLVDVRGLTKTSVYFCAYWILGRPRG